MALLLIILAAAIGYVLFILASPAGRCRTCRGWGTKPRRRRRRTCRKCGGTGIRFRPGATLVHRALSTARRARANGDLTPPPWRPPRPGQTTRNPEGDNRP
jgi:DnaJ-class molecular chaperone